MILRARDGTELSIGNVSEFAFNKSGRYLAMVIDAADQAGNGVQIRDMQSGVITPLETSQSFYERMGWTQEGDALALLKGKDDKQFRERLFAVVGFTGFDKGTPVKTTRPGAGWVVPGEHVGERQPIAAVDRNARRADLGLPR